MENMAHYVNAFFTKAFDIHARQTLVAFRPNNNLKLFITTTTVLPSCPTTPIVSGILPSSANVTSTTTVPNEITRFCRMIRRAR